MMERRSVLQCASALGMTSILARADDEHAHHLMAPDNPGLVESTGNCVAKGEACLAHCLMLLGDGDTSMSGCAHAVNQMLALCGALQKLAIQQSDLVPALAKVALEGCTRCETECKKHENKHAVCKACRESCTECIKQCRAAIA